MSEHAELLLSQLLAEQRKTNELLRLLIEAMGDVDPDPDDEIALYMDGSPVR